MKIIIGAPLYKRDWILPQWIEAIEKQDFPMENLGFVFLMGPSDIFTLHELMKFHRRHPEFIHFDLMVDKEEEHIHHHESGARHWSRDRYHTMAKFRNKILDRITIYKPDRYFSLDTDILLENPKTISTLARMVNDGDAVAPLAFMTPEGIEFPNTMTWSPMSPDRSYRGEYPLGTVFKTDVIMASVMMTPKVYTRARYDYHPQGEDIGWSNQCRVADLKLYLASNIYAPHIMSNSALKQYLENGDPRGDFSQGSGEDRSVQI